MHIYFVETSVGNLASYAVINGMCHFMWRLAVVIFINPSMSVHCVPFLIQRENSWNHLQAAMNCALLFKLL